MSRTYRKADGFGVLHFGPLGLRGADDSDDFRERLEPLEQKVLFVSQSYSPRPSHSLPDF